MAKRKAGRAKAAPAKARKAARKAAAGRKARATSAGRRSPGKAAKRTAKSASKATRKRTGATARKAATGRPKPQARKQTAKPKARKAARRPAKKALVARKAPALNRERRTVVDDDIVQTPPSSLNLDRTASAARTGRRELKERYDEHTETSPALTGGDIDADWESAYSVGDEAPGGDSPTPDQDIVDDIGRAVGIEYQDNEELKGANKVEQRDRKRWELDPASSEDWDDR